MNFFFNNIFGIYESVLTSQFFVKLVCQFLVERQRLLSRNIRSGTVVRLFFQYYLGLFESIDPQNNVLEFMLGKEEAAK